MPNWCSNEATFYHTNPEIIQKIKNGAENKDLFETFVPLNGNDGILEASETWGTKWDICEPYIISEEDNLIVIRFDTAWSPPIEFYQKLEQNYGVEIKAFFYEPGMAFMGGYESGNEWDHPWPQTPEDYENIPSELDNAFGISDHWYDEGIEEYAEGL